MLRETFQLPHNWAEHRQAAADRDPQRVGPHQPGGQRRRAGHRPARRQLGRRLRTLQGDYHKSYYAIAPYVLRKVVWQWKLGITQPPQIMTKHSVRVAQMDYSPEIEISAISGDGLTKRERE